MKKQIALQYARLKRDTSRYRERMQTKFEYSAGGTNNAAKIPHQMSLFIKQHQKQVHLRNDSKTTVTQESITLLYPKRTTPKQIQK